MTCPKEKRHGGNRGVSEKAGIWDGSGDEHTCRDVASLFLARVALEDAAQAQLDVFVIATDDPHPAVVDAADQLEAAAIDLAQLADFAPQKGREWRCRMVPPRLIGNRCQCQTCGGYFGSVRGFDRNRIGAVGAPDRRCLSAVGLLSAGWHRFPRGFFPTPDARLAGASISGPCEPPPATGVPGVMP